MNIKNLSLGDEVEVLMPNGEWATTKVSTIKHPDPEVQLANGLWANEGNTRWACPYVVGQLVECKADRWLPAVVTKIEQLDNRCRVEVTYVDEEGWNRGFSMQSTHDRSLIRPRQWPGSGRPCSACCDTEVEAAKLRQDLQRVQEKYAAECNAHAETKVQLGLATNSAKFIAQDRDCLLKQRDAYIKKYEDEQKLRLAVEARLQQIKNAVGS